MGDAESLENYLLICSKISANFAESDSVHIITAGDFNCQPDSRFYPSITNMSSELNLVLSDINRMTNVFTYCSDSGLNTSWIDHILCSGAIDGLVEDVSVLYDYVSSDHKPLVIKFGSFLPELLQDPPSAAAYATHFLPDWSRVVDSELDEYESALSTALADVNIPVHLLGNHDYSINTAHLCINEYYNNIVSCLHSAACDTLPHKSSRFNDCNIPGWNDIVGEKHDLAREAFLEWVYFGKPRQGSAFMHMKRTRASFKLALRYCKQHEEYLRADACARDLYNKDFKQFWNSVHKINNNKATKYANSVGGADGEYDVANMWRNHFEQLYSSVDGKSAKDLFLSRISEKQTCLTELPLTILMNDVVDVVRKQKKGKAVGPDGIAMEAILFGGLRLCIHLSFLFNMFLHYSYLPPSFMDSTIVPLVKCKNGDLADVDNYRAIAISTALSKVFEGTLLGLFNSDSDIDCHQFGFKANHSTGLCTEVFKRTVEYYSERGSHVFACFIDFTKAFDRVNYWTLFNKLLDNNIDSKVVTLLAYWYSHQEICVRWRNTLSSSFKVSNGTRQGGVLSPVLFTIYIRKLLSDVCDLRIGCNIGGVFYNVLSYADDIVLLAPSWAALQTLINALHDCAINIDMLCNTKKTVCMVFEPKCRKKSLNVTFPQFTLGDNTLQFVDEFKYLGHIIVPTMSDADDIKREIRSMFYRTNILIRRYSHCSNEVKLVLFKSYCVCFYDIALWRHYNSSIYNKLQSCYNKCIKLFVVLSDPTV